MERSQKLKNLVITAMLCALAYVVTLLLPVRVQFLTLDFKDAVIGMISLLFGPVYGVLSALVVALVETVTVSATGLYGLIMNFLSSGTFALVTGLIYHYRRTFSGAICTVSLGALSVTTVMLAADYVVIPLFLSVSHEQVLTLVLPLLLPFNLVKSVLNGSLVLLLYKPVVTVLRKNKLLPSPPQTASPQKRRSIILLAVTLCVIALSVCFAVLVLGASV